MKTQLAFNIILYLFLHIFCSSLSVYAGQWTQRGQISVWSGASADQRYQMGIRWLPEGALRLNCSDAVFSELRLSLNTYASLLTGQSDLKTKLYRLQWRLVTPQSETRIGLQKISFGPARLLRSLRWFDRMDPTDPLRLTSGVYALRYTYNFINNSAAWFWIMYGNTQTKGFEMLPSVSTKPEFGGRLQMPVPFGEAGITAHSRRVNQNASSFTENRLALDGRVDIFVGAWFEASVQKSETRTLPFPWQKQLTLGSDYTFGIGNGLYILAEHLFVSVSEDLFKNRLNGNTSAFMLSYPFGIFDSFQAFAYYSWNSGTFFQYYNWQRTFDSFILNFSLFHYPVSKTPLSSMPLSGLGAQMMFIFYY